MSERNTIVRSLHDVGLAAWFGGSPAGAVAVNTADVRDVTSRVLLRHSEPGDSAPREPTDVAGRAK